nr:uncharacterized protein LOC101233767 [Taeniopygia guttata]
MATLTLGQMLEAALGSSRDGLVDFEQLHNLLNAMLLHLGLRDLLVQENGEPLEGAEESPFSFLKELKQKVEANEKEIAEVRALCQELREEVNVVKEEQSHMAEDMQYMLQNLDMEGFQNMLKELCNQMMESLMSAMKEMMQGGQGSDKQKHAGSRHLAPDSTDDPELIVIGNEITLVEKPRTPRHGDGRAASPLPPDARTPGRGKEENASSDLLPAGEDATGQNVEQSDRGRSGTARRGLGWSMGQNYMGRSVGQRDMRRNVQWSDAGQEDMGQEDMGQIKDEEIEVHISTVEDLPSPSQGGPSEMTSMEEIKEEDTKMSISEAPPHSQKKSLDGSFTTSGTHPRAPGTHLPVQRVQSVRGHPGSQNLWVPAESMAGTSRGSRLTASKEARGRGIRMEAFPAEAGMMLLKVPSSEYTPCDQLVQLPGRHSEAISATPPPSPGFSMRLPRARRQHRVQEHREQPVEGYSRRPPLYSGGKHTSVSPVKPMKPLLPNPNEPGTFELMGRDGVVYRGRTPPGMD